MEIFSAARQLITNPKKFFDSVQDQKLKQPLMYGVLCLLLSGFIWTFIILHGGGPKLDGPEYRAAGWSLRQAQSVILATYHILVFVSMLLFPLFVHLGIKLVQGKGNRWGAYRAWIYPVGVELVLVVIPFVSLIGFFWMVAMQVIGLSRAYGVSTSRAIGGFAIGLAYAILTAVVVLGLLYVISSWLAFGHI